MSERLVSLRQKMNEKDIEAVILIGRPNTLYLSGFTGSTSFLFITDSEAVLVVDFRYTIQAKRQVYPGIKVLEQQEGFLKAINELIGKAGVKKVGFEGNCLTFTEYTSMKEKLTNANSFITIGSLVDRMRMVKDEGEIQCIQEAVLLGDKVFDHIIGYIKPGVTENEIAAEMEHKMKTLGAKGPSFETIVAAGIRSAMCHGTATDNVLKAGDAIVLDFGVIYKNYCSDMTRTVFLGEPSPDLKKIYTIVKKAQQAGLDAIVAGLTGKQADAIARDIIDVEGYGKCFGHSLGHGVGLEIHENPRLSQASEDTLDNGMVFSVEPGIYVEGIGGVRIEDMVFLSEGKVRNFTTSTKELLIL